MNVGLIFGLRIRIQLLFYLINRMKLNSFLCENKTFAIWATALFIISAIRPATGQNVNATWGANNNSAWYTGSNWVGGSYPGQQGASPVTNTNTGTFTSAFTGTTVGININTNPLNLGAISVDNTRTTALNIGNRSTTVAGPLRLFGATVNSVANTVLRNNGSALLTIQGNQTSQAMSLVLSNTTDNIINCDGSGGISITAIISGATSTCGLTKTGVDDLTLVTNNTYTGKTKINAGNIIGSGESMFGASPASFTPDQITFNGGALVASGGINFSSNRGITISAGGGTFNTNGNTITLTNVVTGTGAIAKTGTGTLLLAGAHTFTGPVTVSTGTVQLNAAGTYPDASALALSAGTIFDLKGFSETTGSLSGTGTVTSTAAGNITLTTGGNNTTTTFAGVIQNGSAASVGFTKAGTGTMTLSGINTYTGATTVNAGTLFINGSTASGSAVSVTSAGTLAGGGTAAGTVSLSGTVSPGNAAGTTGQLSTGAFTFNTSSIYKFEMSNVAGTQGTASGWDLINSSGAVTVNSTSANPMVINLTSVGTTGFNTCTSYTWTLAKGTSVSGFAATKFSINTSGFAPVFNGAFSVQSTATTIDLVYTAAINTINLSSAAGTNAQTVCINTPITTITYTTTLATGATFSGLPTGVTGNWSSNTVTINGTPAVANNFTYTVTLTGGCGNINTTGTILVKTNNTITLTSGAGTNNQSKCVNTSITTITYTTTGATGANITGLPTGVSGNWASNTVTISGTPTTSGTFTYTVALTGGCGTISSTGTLTIKSVAINAISDQTVCGGKTVNAVTFSSTPAGASFAWINNNTNIGLGGSGSGTISSFVSPVVSSVQTGNITVIAALNGCNAPSVNFNITINGSLPVSIWTGAVSSDWFNPDNWSNCVCGSTTDATINSVTNSPVLNATGEVQTLTLNSGATLTLQSSAILNSYGDISNDGTIDAQIGSTVLLEGSSLQTIGGSQGIDFSYLTLDNSSGAFLSAATGITGTLLLNNGTLNTNNLLTLAATEAGTSYTNGNIGPISPTADISGNVTVEQYAVRSGTMNWGFLGAPMDNASGLTMADWNDDFAITCTNCPDGSTTGGTTFTSIYSYNETGSGLYDDASKYSAITNITDPIEFGKGYWVYLGNGLGTSIKFEVAGSIAKANISDIMMPLTYTDHGTSSDDGWNLISNPFPCPVSWAALLGSTTDVDDGIYVYNSNTATYSQYVAGVSSPAVGTGGIGDEIPMCQGFYVHSTGGTSLTASESIKVPTSNPDFLRINPNAPSVQNYIPVPRLFLNGAGGSRDETAFHFNSNSSTAFDAKYDTYKLIGDYTLPYVAGMSSDGEMCSINGLPNQNTSIPVKAITPATGVFVFSLGGDTVTGTCVNLYDSYTGVTTNLSTSSYTCTLHDTTTMARFTLAFSSGALTATTAIAQPACNYPQGSITAIGTNTGPWNYVWKDDNGVVIRASLNKTTADTLAPASGGNYTVEMNTAGQCDHYSETFGVNSVEIPSAQFTASEDTVDLALSGYVYFEPVMPGNNSYSWNFGDSLGVSSLFNPTYNYQATGTFTVVLTASSVSNCIDTASMSITVINTTPAVGLQAAKKEGSIKLVNTGSSNCTLLFGGKTNSMISYSIYDLGGKEIISANKLQATGGKLDIDVSGMASGLYLLKVEPEGQEPVAFRLNKY
jgi:autotransporter-associated beta strand protein